MTNCKNCNAILTHNNGRIYCEYCGTVYNDYSHINPMLDNRSLSPEVVIECSGLFPDLGGDTDTIEVTTLNGFHEFVDSSDWYTDGGLKRWINRTRSKKNV